MPCEKQVMEFHVKNEMPIFVSIKHPKRCKRLLLKSMQVILSMMGKICWKISGGGARGQGELFFDLHLILEEVSETLDAILQKDTYAIVDALSDLLYVIYGFGVTYRLPLEEAFEEVHQANMTKNFKVNHRRLYKGENWVPPNIELAVYEGRLRQLKEYKEIKDADN